MARPLKPKTACLRWETGDEGSQLRPKKEEVGTEGKDGLGGGVRGARGERQ